MHREFHPRLFRRIHFGFQPESDLCPAGAVGRVSGQAKKHLGIVIIETASTHLVAQAGGIVGADKNSGQRIVIRHRDGIEFMGRGSAYAQLTVNPRIERETTSICSSTLSSEEASLETLVHILYAEREKTRGSELPFAFFIRRGG